MKFHAFFLGVALVLGLSSLSAQSTFDNLINTHFNLNAGPPATLTPKTQGNMRDELRAFRDACAFAVVDVSDPSSTTFFSGSGINLIRWGSGSLNLAAGADPNNSILIVTGYDTPIGGENAWGDCDVYTSSVYVLGGDGLQPISGAGTPGGAATSINVISTGHVEAWGGNAYGTGAGGDAYASNDAGDATATAGTGGLQGGDAVAISDTGGIAYASAGNCTSTTGSVGGAAEAYATGTSEALAFGGAGVTAGDALADGPDVANAVGGAGLSGVASTGGDGAAYSVYGRAWGVGGPGWTGGNATSDAGYDAKARGGDGETAAGTGSADGGRSAEAYGGDTAQGNGAAASARCTGVGDAYAVGGESLNGQLGGPGWIGGNARATALGAGPAIAVGGAANDIGGFALAEALYNAQAEGGQGIHGGDAEAYSDTGDADATGGVGALGVGGMAYADASTKIGGNATAEGGVGNTVGGFAHAVAKLNATATGGDRVIGSNGDGGDALAEAGLTATADGGLGLNGGDAEAYSDFSDAEANGGDGEVGNGGMAIAQTDRTNGGKAWAYGGDGGTVGGDAYAEARENAAADGGDGFAGSNGDGGDAEAYSELGDTTGQGWVAQAICGSGAGSGSGGFNATAHGGPGVTVYVSVGQSGSVGAYEYAK